MNYFYFIFLDLEIMKNMKNYRDFDHHVTIKLFPFETVEDYYIKSSSLDDVQHLKIPSLFFNAKDDKLSPVDTLDLETSFRSNKNIILILTKWGGHVCWFEGVRKPKRVKLIFYNLIFYNNLILNFFQWFIPKAIKFVETIEELDKNKIL